MLFAKDEKILVIFRRLFEQDIRQHFVGEIETVTPIAVRATGYTFLFDVDSGKFVRKQDIVTRIIPLGQSGVLISLLPESVELKNLVYQIDTKRNLIITDNQAFSQGMVEFSGKFNTTR